MHSAAVARGSEAGRRPALAPGRGRLALLFALTALVLAIAPAGAHANLARVISLEENAPVGRHGIEHYRAVRGDDDLQIVAQRELLQLQHEELLDPPVQSCFDPVSQHQRTF